jgi:hypothetical protein
MPTDVDKDSSTLVAVSEEMNNSLAVEAALVANNSERNLLTQLMTTTA